MKIKDFEPENFYNPVAEKFIEAGFIGAIIIVAILTLVKIIY